MALGSAPNISFFDYLTAIGIPLTIFLSGCIFVSLGIWLLRKTKGKLFSKNNLIALAILGIVFTLLSVLLYLPSIINKFSPRFVLSGNKIFSITKVSKKDIPDNLYLPQPRKKAPTKTWLSSLEFKKIFHRNLQQVIKQKGSIENLPILVEDKLYHKDQTEIKKHFSPDAEIGLLFPNTKQYIILAKKTIKEEYEPDNASPDKKSDFFIIRKANKVIRKGRVERTYDSFIFIRDRGSNKLTQYPITTFNPYCIDNGSIRWVFPKFILFGGSDYYRKGFIFNTQNGQFSQFFDAERTPAIYYSPDGKKAVIHFMSNHFHHGDGSSYLYDNLALFEGGTGATIFIVKFKIQDRVAGIFHSRFNDFLGWKNNNKFYFSADNADWKTTLH